MLPDLPLQLSVFAASEGVEGVAAAVAVLLLALTVGGSLLWERQQARGRACVRTAQQASGPAFHREGGAEAAADRQPVGAAGGAAAGPVLRRLSLRELLAGVAAHEGRPASALGYKPAHQLVTVAFKVKRCMREAASADPTA